VQKPLRICLGAGAKVEERSDEIPLRRGKNWEELINYTIRFMWRVYLKLSWYKKNIGHDY
jgi:hypothetical protein